MLQRLMNRRFIITIIIIM